MAWLSQRNIPEYRICRRSFPKVSQIPKFCLIILMSIPIFFIAYTKIGPNPPYTTIQRENRIIVNKGYLIDTIGCKIPDFPVSSSDMGKYFQYEFDGAHCNEDIPPLVQSNLTSLFLNKTSLLKYNISNVNSLHCCYKELRRSIPENGPDINYVLSSICFNFRESIKVKEEFVHVKCVYENETVYEDVFAFIPFKYNTTLSKLNHDQFNVLIIGLDGISRLNFHRQMTESVKFLQKLEFVEFLGYNKIADNTYPNLINVLTGKNEKTIRNSCRKYSKYYDNCGFIWDIFKSKNYTTSFAEDSAWMGIFNYRKHGFQKQPTDYMWGFFDRVGEMLLGNSRVLNVIQCIGPREAYKMLVQYVYDFVSRMESWKVPYFAFFWSSSLSHDDLNKPRIGDKIYLNLFRNLYENEYFNTTIVIVMSDHGIRYGSFRQTYQGRIEEMLPLLFIRLPEVFKEKYPLATSNLKRNARVLTNPLDVYETLVDIASPDKLADQFILQQQQRTKNKTGYSLFHEINSARTCEDAGIADHWCTCLDSRPVMINSNIIKLANFTINYMNEMLSGYDECHNLHLKNVTIAQVLHHKKCRKRTTRDFVITFQTSPGDGLFEATVRQGKKKMEVVGSISRLNFYGQQSACMTDFYLKLYCYCKKSIWRFIA